jgi:beta-glucosidase
MADARDAATDGFPSGFLWGCATASYQIEGSASADGKGPSIWDSFSHRPGKVFGGHNGDFACDSYRRWKDDIELLKGLGVDSYRFSVSWPRIQPEGRGKPLQAGLDYYRRLADGLGEAGIASAVTLYHWDLPQALEDSGGWPERDTAYRFAEYADIVYRALGDRASQWFTLNEPWCSAFLGYENGEHAPGRADRAAAYRAVHHLLLAHGLGVRAHASEGVKAPVGIVLNAMMSRPASESVADAEAAELAAEKGAAIWLDPIYGRGYPGRLLEAFGVEMPVEPGDMEIIASPIGFVGINYYTEAIAEADPSNAGGYREYQSSEPKTEMDWAVTPDGLFRLLSAIASRWPVPALYVTENGAAFADRVENDGSIHDRARVDYLRSHIAACRKALDAGIPLKGYFLWSLMDNFEWAYGFSKRFGIVHVDFENGDRRCKDSYYFYRDIIDRNK